MKQLFLILITSLFSQLSFADSAVLNYTSKFERFVNAPITKQGLSVASQRTAAFLAVHKTKLLGLGTLSVGGIVWYNYLIQHPDKMSHFFSTHPELLEKFSDYVDYRIEHSQNERELQTFQNVKEKLALDDEANLVYARNLENDPIYIDLRKDVINEIANIDQQLTNNNQNPQYCSTSVIAQLTMDSNTFETTINTVSNVNILPQIQQVPNETHALDVNTFKRLTSGYRKSSKTHPLEQDHIPSYAAINKYLNDHGIKTNHKYIINFKGNKIPIRDKNLANNTTAIAIPYDIHKEGRTFGGFNSPKQIDKDSKNLFGATIEDITTIAYFFLKNNQYNITAQDYIKSSMYIYIRNKMLCLYDVK